MAKGLQQRVQARGFPSSVAAGMTGAGALESQGGPTDPIHGQVVMDAGRFHTVGPYVPGSDPIAPVQIVMLEGAFGLPGSLSDPDQTPRSHAAPVPGWAGAYQGDPDLLVVRVNSTEIHGADFGALAIRQRSIGALGREPDYDRWTSNDPGSAPLQQLDGQIRAMGGYDTTQGYDLRNRYGFDAGHRDRITAVAHQPHAYLDPAERVFIVPQASGSYTPTDAYQGPQPWASGWDAGAINAVAPTAYTPAPEPPTAPAVLVAGAPVSAGWW